MADRPEDHPDFAMENVVDPVSGQNNSAKPPAPYPARGWARNEIPPRQYDNWVKRTVSLWIRWLEQKVDEFSGIFNAATPEATPETLMSRDEDGRAQVADPERAQDIATRGFVDNSLAAARREYFNNLWGLGSLVLPGLAPSTSRIAVASLGLRSQWQVNVALYDTVSQEIRLFGFEESEWSGPSAGRSYPVPSPTTGVGLCCVSRSANLVSIAITDGASIQVFQYNAATDDWVTVGSPVPISVGSRPHLEFLSDRQILVSGESAGGSVQAYELVGSQLTAMGEPLILNGSSGSGAITLARAMTRSRISILHRNADNDIVILAYDFDGEEWTEGPISPPLAVSGLVEHGYGFTPINSDTVLMLNQSGISGVGFQGALALRVTPDGWLVVSDAVVRNESVSGTGWRSISAVSGDLIVGINGGPDDAEMQLMRVGIGLEGPPSPSDRNWMD